MKTLIACIVLSATAALAQGKQNDIPVDKLPPEVKAVLDEYLNILRTSADVEAAAKGVIKVAGGGLVDEAGTALRDSVKPYSLKKDFSDVKFYAEPTNITRVNASPSGGQGFGGSAISGMVYKIWIGKKDGAGGMPAPISIMVPQGHATIKTPKVVNIGSL